MTEPLPVLVENSLEVAWDFLHGLGEIKDPQETAEFLLRSIQSQILRGETRTLMLSNRAIEAHQRQLQLASWSTRNVPFALVWVGCVKTILNKFGMMEVVSAGRGCLVNVSGLASKGLTTRRLLLKGAYKSADELHVAGSWGVQSPGRGNLLTAMWRQDI
jgi:hypothetical protein